MIWALTKNNYDLSAKRLVRWWLRLGAGRRFWFCVLLTIVYTPSVLLLVSATTPHIFGYYNQPAESSPFNFLTLFMPLPLLFWVIDAVWDWLGVHRDCREIVDGRTAALLVTRAEYRGGHYKLPYGRFVYLALGGTQAVPEVTIILPTSGKWGTSFAQTFVIPVLEIAKSRSLLTHVISHNTVLGKEPVFEVEYTSPSGRKLRVEIAHFFHGAEEVYLWRNFIVCIQGEADTGERPFGRWSSLPKGTLPHEAEDHAPQPLFSQLGS